MPRVRRWLLVVYLVLALASCSYLQGPAPAPKIEVDSSAAASALDLLEAAHEGNPWSRARIAQLLATPPYQGLLAHHSRMDSQLTGESLLDALADVQKGEMLPVSAGRIARMQASYRAALDRIPELRSRLEVLSDPAVAQAAAERALAALPRRTPLEAKVLVVADGYSPTYVEGNTIYLDVLEVADASQAELCLAHELHHIGVSSITPQPCADPAVGTGLDAIVGLVQEGSATYWIDGWRGRPSTGDMEAVQSFLLDVLEGRLQGDDVGTRLSALLGPERGPLYQVGNTMIADLVEAHGDAWVQARLGDPVGLLRAYEPMGKWPGLDKVLAALDSQRGVCPDWIRR